MKGGIYVYGASASGGHAVGVDIGNGLRVLVTPSGPELDTEAVALARSIVATSKLGEQLQSTKAECENLRNLLAKSNAALEHALAGKRRFFGRCLLLPELAGAWDGAVWLYDPEKRDRGMGIRFASLTELRETYPELWVAGTLDGGVLLDAAPLPSTKGGDL